MRTIDALTPLRTRGCPLARLGGDACLRVTGQHTHYTLPRRHSLSLCVGAGCRMRIAPGCAVLSSGDVQSAVDVPLIRVAGWPHGRGRAPAGLKVHSSIKT